MTGKVNDRQRRFAELVVKGRPAGRAYEEAGFSSRGNVADSAATRLLRNVQVAAYIEQLRAEAKEAAKMDLSEMQQFLADAIRTPVGAIDENHPLCQEYYHLEERGGSRGKLKRGDAPEGNEVATEEQRVIKVKSVDKLRAAHLLIGVNGWNKPQELQISADEKLLELMSRVRRK